MHNFIYKPIHIHCVTALIVACILSLLLSFGLTNAANVIVLIQGNRTATIGTDTLDFGSNTTSATDQIIDGITLGTEGIVVTDMQNGYKAWSVTFSADNFNGPSTGNTISYQNIEMKGDDDGIIDVIGGSSGTEGVTTFSTFTALTGTGSVSDDLTLISADKRNRQAEYQTFPEVKLTIDGYTPADIYTNTFTFTFIVS